MDKGYSRYLVVLFKKNAPQVIADKMRIRMRMRIKCKCKSTANVNETFIRTVQMRIYQQFDSQKSNQMRIRLIFDSICKLRNTNSGRGARIKNRSAQWPLINDSPSTLHPLCALTNGMNQKNKYTFHENWNVHAHEGNKRCVCLRINVRRLLKNKLEQIAIHQQCTLEFQWSKDWGDNIKQSKSSVAEIAWVPQASFTQHGSARIQYLQNSTVMYYFARPLIKTYSIRSEP